MLSDLVPLPWNRKKQLEPKIYRMTCSKCDYAEDLAIKNPNMETIRNPDCEHSHELREVDTLPTVCPKCGAKLQKIKISVKINY